MTTKEGKTTAAVAYLTFVGAVIAIFMNLDSKNEFARFHIRQAIGIHLLFIILQALVSGFNSWMISWSFWVFVFVLWGYGFSGALQGNKSTIPFLGKHFQQWFQKIA